MRHLFTISGRYAATEDAPIPTQISGLSWSTRLKAFVVCIIAAVILGIIAIVLYFLGGNISGFAIMYSLAVLCGVASTFFLTGPLQQLKNMFQPSRLIATIVFLICLVMTFVSAIVIKISLLVILFLILQLLALLWYTISYIPFARDAIKACCRGLIS